MVMSMRITKVTPTVNRSGIICYDSQDTKKVLKMLFHNALGRNSEGSSSLFTRIGRWSADKIDNWYASVLVDSATTELKTSKWYTASYGNPIPDLSFTFNLLDEVLDVVIALEIKQRNELEVEAELAKTIRRERCIKSIVLEVDVAVNNNGQFVIDCKDLARRFNRVVLMREVSASDLANSILKVDHWGVSTPKAALVKQTDPRVELTLNRAGLRFSERHPDPYAWAMDGTVLFGRVPPDQANPPGIRIEIFAPGNYLPQRLIWREWEVQKFLELLSQLERAFQP